MDIALPPGFLSAAPFDREKHKRLGIRENAKAFAQHLNVVFVTAAEFPSACHDYPIAFAEDSPGIFTSVIITGLESGTNLYVDEQGAWLHDYYCPAYVRRYPFFTATINEDGNNRALVCVDDSALTADAPALVNARGEPTERWRELEVLVNEMDSEQRKTALLCQRLKELDLLEPFDADFHPRGLSEVRVTGLRRVSEQRLRQLNGDGLHSLMRDGHLARIYAHLLSFGKFTDLLNRHGSAAR